MTTKNKIKKASKSDSSSVKYESVNIDSIFPTLDAISWLSLPDVKQVSQFTGIEPRTIGKILKNCMQIGLVQSVDNKYALCHPYPYKGSEEQKKAVIRETLIRLPLITSLKQFISLGDSIESALRKAATIAGVTDFDPKHYGPLLKWSKTYNVLETDVRIDDLIDEASSTKEERHKSDSNKKIAFISHSSKDKPFIRQLTADLTNEGVSVWLDEQKILVGDSISDKISQGLIESDYFLIALSEASINSSWVQKELNAALINEIEKRKVKVIPIKLSECEIPVLIKDKKYADFSVSYKTGLSELLRVFK